MVTISSRVTSSRMTSSINPYALQFRNDVKMKYISMQTLPNGRSPPATMPRALRKTSPAAADGDDQQDGEQH